MLYIVINFSFISVSHSRIIIVSSVAHEYGRINWDDINWNKSYDSAMAYAQSKLANVMHGIELARRVKEAGIRVYIVHPGK